MTQLTKALVAITFLLAYYETSLSMEVSKQKIYCNDDRKTTLLMDAARYANVEEVNKYIRLAGMNDQEGRNALIYQFLPSPGRRQPVYVSFKMDPQSDNERSDTKVIHILLKAKEDPNTADKSGMTALMYLLKKLRDDFPEPTNIHNLDLQMAMPIIQVLLENMSKDSINQVNNQGETALSIAGCIRNGGNTKTKKEGKKDFDVQTNIVQLLLEKGADPYIVPIKKGQTREDAWLMAYLNIWRTLSNEEATNIFFNKFCQKDPQFIQRNRNIIGEPKP